ncbi:hypothetical protein NEMBOFW57_001977 [Staphylotrichum longicolle]|uniref:Rhodopsin domain-containing protein n=1 Tax=Staphylotrichum longicolle TaxID=669026 RepID=A0AAD4I494_9PEZI|nr:hypothetical protein NEMBOFW57_001977 [Staphylotrichum longicolle]
MVVYVDLSTNPKGVTIIAILLLASCAASTTNARLGFGLRFYQVPLENLLTFGVLSNISGFTSIIAVACSKTSFAITLLRLSDGWMKWFIIALLVLLNTTHYLSALFFWVSCNPPAKTYNVMLPGECWPTSVTVKYSLFVGACSTFCDFALALLPWRLLLRFNMYNREKIGVAIAMSMGVFAGITCIVKMTTIPVLNGDDFSYNSLPLVIWGFLEPTLTICAASIPMMRHLFKSLRREGEDGPSRTTTSGGMTSTAGHNSIGGGHENRRAAARANHNRAADRTQRSQRSRLSHFSLRSQQQEQQQGSRGASQQLEERPPKARDDNRSDSSILAAPATGNSTATLGMSESGAGEKAPATASGYEMESLAGKGEK